MTAQKNLLSCQWDAYPRAHQARLNLVLHALTAPFFLLGLAGLPFVGPTSLLLLPLAIAAQKLGHDREEHPPEPFRSPFDVVARLFLEQLVTFPRFILSGGFARAWRASRARDSADARIA